MATEDFVSLREALAEAVEKKFGKDYWLDEFSKNEVILGKSSSAKSYCPGPSGSKSWAVKYSISGEKVTFSGGLTAVKRITGYARANKAAKEELSTKVAEEVKADAAKEG